MLKIQRYQDTHLPLIRNRFSFGKPDHFPVPSNRPQSKVAGITLHWAFSPPASHGSTHGVLFSPKTRNHGGGWGMLHPQEHPAVCPNPHTAAPGGDASEGRCITSGWRNSRCQPSRNENTGLLLLFLMETPLGVGNKEFKCFAKVKSRPYCRKGESKAHTCWSFTFHPDAMK